MGGARLAVGKSRRYDGVECGLRRRTRVGILVAEPRSDHMATAVAPAATSAAARQWLAAVGKLMSDIERWAKEKDWLTARLEPKSVAERATGTYSVSDLRIRTNSGVLDAAVIGSEISGAEGRVDLVAFPTMDRFMLIRTRGKWVVETDLGFVWPRKWGRATFVELARLLTRTS
jgi:hypothetical protein